LFRSTFEADLAGLYDKLAMRCRFRLHAARSLAERWSFIIVTTKSQV
jgi:hypothetical protein